MKDIEKVIFKVNLTQTEEQLRIDNIKKQIILLKIELKELEANQTYIKQWDVK